jgi:hypothetical protein
MSQRKKKETGMKTHFKNAELYSIKGMIKAIAQSFYNNLGDSAILLISLSLALNDISGLSYFGVSKLEWILLFSVIAISNIVLYLFFWASEYLVVLWLLGNATKFVILCAITYISGKYSPIGRSLVYGLITTIIFHDFLHLWQLRSSWSFFFRRLL